MHRTSFLFFALALSAITPKVLAQNTSLIINEICPSNIDQWVDPSFNFGGWIELYNPTSSDISITDWKFSDSSDNLRMATLRGTLTIPAKGFGTVWFDHFDPKYGKQMVDMKLNCDGGTLYISDASGSLKLSADYPAAISRCSWARTSDGGDTWNYAAQPTPGEANTGTFASQRLDAPVVDEESKVGNSSMTFHVTIPDGCLLRYTTDGSTPTLTNGETSQDGVFTTSVTKRFRFRLFADGYLPSAVTSRTFIKNSANIDLPIISISATQDNLYGSRMGIFTKGTNGRPGRGSNTKCNWNMDWERPAVFEYFTSDGELLLSQEVGLERCGGWSRAWEPWSFKIKANKVYEGQNWLPYPFFDEKPYIKNKTLQIRNGGNDNTCRIKDAALQQIVARSGIDVDYQAYQPVAQFINGVYKGTINMREPNNKHFVYSNYGIDDEELDQFEMSPDSGYVQNCGTKEAFSQLVALSKQSSDENVYQQICQMLDIDAYCNYMAIELYLGNWDWPQNNVKGYRPRLENGKFRFVLFDMDGSFNLGSNAFSTFQGKQIYTFDQLYDAPVSRYTNVEIEVVTLFLELLNNEKFRKQFIDSFCLVAGSVFNPEKSKAIINELANRVAPTQSTYNNQSPWATANDLISHLSSSRQSSMVNALRNFSKMKLSGQTAQTVTLSTNTPEARLLLNGQPIPGNQFSGKLFAPVTVSVATPAGYTFAGWQSCNYTTTTLLPTGSQWRYYDQGSLNGTGWQNADYDDASWSKGKAPLGYGKSNLGTTISYGSNSNNKRPTYYFRTDFQLDATPSANDIFTLDYTVDDGLIVYINGQEAGRYNMPSGNVSYSTYATTYTSGDPDTGSMTLDANLFHQGVNTIAVEVHNNSATSSDIYWNASLSYGASDGGSVVCPTPEFTLPESGTLDLIACFEPKANAHVNPVVINEVSASNSIYINDYDKKNDWVELYNTTDEEIDLEGMYLSDNASKPQKWQIKASGTASTRIPAHGYKIIWCDKLDTDRELHASFKLGNDEGAQVLLTAADGSWQDVLVYPVHDGTQSVGRYPDGGREVFVMTRTTIAKPNQITTINPTYEQPAAIHTLKADETGNSWQLFNLNGQLIATGEGTFQSSGLPSGIYVIRERGNVRKITLK